MTARNDWDTGAREEPDDRRNHPLRGIWVDGKPARLLPPARQHGVLVSELADRARAKPRHRW